MKKGFKHTPETIKKIKDAKTGKKSGPCSELRKKAISEAKKGVPVPEERRERIRQTLKGRPNPEHSAKMKEKYKNGYVSWNAGKSLSAETIEKIRQSNIARGKSRYCFKAKDWSKKIRERDGHKCQKCGITEWLHAHHIIPWKDDESKRFQLENGITLCRSCHIIVELTGKKRSPETIHKLKEINKGRKSPMQGKKHSEEARQKMRAAKIGHIPWNKKQPLK